MLSGEATKILVSNRGKRTKYEKGERSIDIFEIGILKRDADRIFL
jgi:hypothetical protein